MKNVIGHNNLIHTFIVTYHMGTLVVAQKGDGVFSFENDPGFWGDEGHKGPFEG